MCGHELGMARTSNQHEAEDLAQDIVLEIVKSSQNIRDDRAFYGFIWVLPAMFTSNDTARNYVSTSAS